MAGDYTLTGTLLSEPRFQKMVVPFTNEKFVSRESYRQQFTAKAKVNVSTFYGKYLARIGFNSFEQNTPGLWVSNTYAIPVAGRYHIKLNLRVSVFGEA